MHKSQGFTMDGAGDNSVQNETTPGISRSLLVSVKAVIYTSLDSEKIQSISKSKQVKLCEQNLHEFS